MFKFHFINNRGDETFVICNGEPHRLMRVMLDKAGPMTSWQLANVVEPTEQEVVDAGW